MTLTFNSEQVQGQILNQYRKVPYQEIYYGPAICGCPIVIGLSVCVSVHPVRKKWLSPFYCTQVWYIHQTCTNCSSWHDLLIPCDGFCPWPTFHAWVTMVRKKWLSLYYSTYECYIHHTCTNCSSLHDLLIPCGGLCPWPTLHAWVTMVRKKWLNICYMLPWQPIYIATKIYVLSFFVPRLIHEWGLQKFRPVFENL